MQYLIVILAILVTGCAQNEPIQDMGAVGEENQYEIETQNKMIRELVEITEPSIVGKSGLDLALSLATFVHHKNELISENPRFIVVSRFENLFLLLNDPTYGHICGGLAITSMDLLRAYGFQVRLVQMLAVAVDGHVAIEVLIDNRWIAIDPSFNAVFKNDQGELIGYKEIFKTWREQGKWVTHEYINPTKLRIEDYYIPYTNLLHRGRALPPFYRAASSLDIVFPGQEVL